ncbi:anthocyanidin 3-O-glucosyltransferase 5-like [Mangifera indica]|uniref:anthocyanidin 3-O-glucosyltransferase 5-like n=1 Tax=Mangifera indica TaxID=29780 RepID=UPI001CFB441D|nr:anthocyanidin 3-O-glucosyltransferase 5-like [Mangifera indica]
METSISNPHAVLISSPGLGHLIPVLELGKLLVTHHNFEVTIFAVASQTSAAESEMIQAAMSLKPCQIIEISPPNISHLVGPDAAVVTILAVMMRENKSALRAAISSLTSRPNVLIFDLFGTEFFDIADDLGVAKYCFVASNAWFLSLTVYTPLLDKLVQGEYVDQTEPFDIPGCRSVRPEEVVDPMLDRRNQQYFEYVRMGREIPLCDGILINTWEDLQPKALAALRDDKLLGGIVKAPIYTVGPIVRTLEPTGSNREVFDWLDKQPSDSVLYVSLGSGGTLSYEQTIELAWGLELSQQRFIWVVRPPSTAKADGSYFTAGRGGDEFSSFLPEGFLNRIHEVGKLVPKWAPQVKILRHSSVGGFLSHTGWNSTMESISNGLPMIAWPLYAEQRMNATALAEELGVAVRPKIQPSERVVGREEIMTMVRKIMVDEQGQPIRDRAKELKHTAEKAWSSEGGSSYNSLSLLANKWKHP